MLKATFLFVIFGIAVLNKFSTAQDILTATEEEKPSKFKHYYNKVNNFFEEHEQDFAKPTKQITNFFAYKRDYQVNKMKEDGDSNYRVHIKESDVDFFRT